VRGVGRVARMETFGYAVTILDGKLKKQKPLEITKINIKIIFSVCLADWNKLY
jgi:hypothetical protein